MINKRDSISRGSCFCEKYTLHSISKQCTVYSFKVSGNHFTEVSLMNGNYYHSFTEVSLITSLMNNNISHLKIYISKSVSSISQQQEFEKNRTLFCVQITKIFRNV